MLRLRTLGGLSIERLDGPSPSTGAASARRRLALLTVLAVNGDRGVRRDKLLALFWPESDAERARHALVQSLFALKRDLGHDELVIGREELRLNPTVITSDVGELNDALAAGDRERALKLYTGPFLDGFFISGAPEFEHWLDAERTQISRAVESALESLATHAAAQGDHAAAAVWWQRLAAMDPRKTRVVVALMSELAAAGDRAGALRHAEVYQTLVRDDLEAEPNPAVAALADSLKREPMPIAVGLRTPPGGAPLTPTSTRNFADRYVIDREIGRGGSATVYLARDLRHERWVALKVLRPELGIGIAVERFQQEIAVSANLQHPHILAVYEAGEWDGSLYFAMPYVEGESLRQRLDRERTLSVADAVHITREVADALIYAHRRGIVHRDIKPENILITSGHAIVVDFGLARALATEPDAGAKRRTFPGTVVGTPVYLSPEVAAGSRDADARSDQYSLACVLYEMLVGEAPTADTDVRAATLPMRLRSVLQRALAADPANRYADVTAFARALAGGTRLDELWTRRNRLVAASVGAFAIISLVAWTFVRVRAPVVAERAWILPADVENETADSVFDHALDAAIVTGLEQSAYVNVFPRTLVQRTLTRLGRGELASKSLTDSLARDVAQREGVRAVVTSAISRLDSSYLLTLRLVEPVSGASIASESAVAPGRGQVLGVLDQLVRRFRARIGESSSLLSKHDRPLARATTASLEALRKYSSCAQAWDLGARSAAIALCEQAVSLDSEFAMAHAVLGMAYYWTNNRPAGDAHFDRALAHVDRLTDRERFVVEANVEAWRGNRDRAIQIRQALLEQYPDDRAAWEAIGYDLLRLHRPREAIDAYQHQLAVDSSDAFIYVNMGVCYKDLGEYDKAVSSYQHAFSRSPAILTQENINHEYGNALILAGRLDDARSAYEAMLRGNGDQQARGHRSLALLEMMRGRYGDATGELRRAAELTQAMHQPLSEARNRLFLVAAEREKGWSDSARTELDRVYAIFRESYLEPAFLVMFGKQLVAAGQTARATEVLDSLTRRTRPGNQSDQAWRWQLAGELAIAEQRPDSGLRLVRMAYASDASIFVATSLANALAAAGDLRGAVREYSALASARRDWIGWEAEPYGLLASRDEGRVDELLKDSVAARAAYNRLLLQWPDGDQDLEAVREARTRLTALGVRDASPRR